MGDTDSREGQRSQMVAVDLDNVIVATDPEIRSIIAALCGLTLSEADIQVFSYAEVLESKGLDTARALEIQEEALRIFHEQRCREAAPVEGALDGLRSLAAAGLQLEIVTSRPPDCGDNTTYWLERHSCPVRDLIFLEDKASAANRWAILVDDAAHHATAMAAGGGWVCVLDRPWNRSISTGPRILRAADWTEVVTVVLDVLNAQRRSRIESAVEMP